MSESGLPELAAGAAPEFTDEESCRTWLESVPLANVAASQRELLAQLGEFNRFATRATARLAVMEALREAVNFVQIEQAKRFTNRSQPMAENELQVFRDTIALWDEMRIGYLHVLAAARDGEGGLESAAALVCQRALAYAGLKLFHHYRAYQRVPAEAWRQLHATYRHAETLGVAETPVKDFLNRDVHDTSPRIAYTRALMLGVCNPNELSQRQLTFVAYLLERWAEKVSVTNAPPAEADMPPLTVDLAGDGVPERSAEAATGAREPRYLDVSRLGKSLRNRIGLLRKGESPAKLALGEDCVQPACEQMLVSLYRHWCQARVPRPERSRASTPAQVCNNFIAIHYYIGGRVFRQPGEQRELTKKEREEIATFGRISTRDEDDFSTVQGFLLENWSTLDESAQGLRIARPADSPGHRYTVGQIITMRPADAKTFMLGQVRWLSCAQNGDLHAGVRVLLGLPAAVAVRATGLNVAKEKYVQALSLTAVSAINAPPTLVLPSGWFKPKRVIEVFVDTPVRARLLEVLERGIDFERVSYEIID